MTMPTLGEFEQLVLLALIRLGDAAYGVPIRDEIHRRAGRNVSLATVYKTLERLEAKGCVSSTVGEPTAERGGRRKRVLRPGPRRPRAPAQARRASRPMS